MNKKLISFAAVALVLTACSSEEPITPPMTKNDAVGANPYRVSLTDALKNADALLGELGEGEATRSTERKVESVEYYSRPGTRALGGDTLLYLVNYADDAGFALLSADSRLRPIYAISDEGSMSFSDTTYNKGLALFARGVESELVGFPDNPLPFNPSDSSIYNPIIPDFGGTYIKSKVAPLLTPSVREWGQGLPYSSQCFTSEGYQAKVGCAAVAVGQIMSYHSWPQSYNGISFYWNSINNGGSYMNLAQFLRQLGNPENLDMTYGRGGQFDNGSSAYPERYIPTFANMGYLTPNSLQSFYSLAVKIYLDKALTGEVGGGPVLVNGYQKNSNDQEVLGHAWVIDGYIQYESKGSLVPGGYLLHDTLFHCVWGWDGQSNGYFWWDKYNSFSGDPREKEEDDYPGNIQDSSDLLFNYNVKFMCGFVPNK
ncbi:MAG: C10 family peptidase [Muribaculaceae bacterium]|nr:C10 family peptidase [Muribaculaceae bacterium]